MTDAAAAPGPPPASGEAAPAKPPAAAPAPASPNAAPDGDKEKPAPRSLRSWLLIGLGVALALAAVRYLPASASNAASGLKRQTSGCEALSPHR